MAERVYVTFGESAAGSLFQAIQILEAPKPKLAIRASIKALVEDMNIGPIADARRRARYRREHLWFDRDTSMHVASFWRWVGSTENDLVVCTSRRSAREYCGLLAVCARAEHAAISVIDAATLGAQAFAHVPAEHIVKQRLLAKPRRLSQAQRSKYRDAWTRLLRENAGVRILRGRTVVSQPATCFDDALLANVTGEWERCMRIVADALSAICATYDQVSDGFLVDRLLTLVDDGVIEWRTQVPEPELRDLEVRRLSGSSGSRGPRRGGAGRASAT